MHKGGEASEEQKGEPTKQGVKVRNSGIPEVRIRELEVRKSGSPQVRKSRSSEVGKPGSSECPNSRRAEFRKSGSPASGCPVVRSMNVLIPDNQSIRPSLPSISHTQSKIEAEWSSCRCAGLTDSAYVQGCHTLSYMQGCQTLGIASLHVIPKP